MGRAPALLTRPPVVAWTALVAFLAAYYAAAPDLPSVREWWDVAWLAVVLIPAVFALVWLALPLLEEPPGRLVAGAAVFGVAAAVLHVADADALASFAKLGCATLLAFATLFAFTSPLYPAAFALLIPWIDIWSVARGPTGDIVENRPGIFEAVSFAFPIAGDEVWSPGVFERLRAAATAATVGGADVVAAMPVEHATARLGFPDLLFFALFLGAAVRFDLRPGWTWLALTASFGVTIALTVGLDVSGLPALPGLSLGFLLPNADLLWRRLQAARSG